MEQHTIAFIDLDDGDEATVIVRRVEEGIGLTLSKSSGSDLEAFISAFEAQKVAEALRSLTQ
jgi:hypothetical protein